MTPNRPSASYNSVSRTRASCGDVQSLADAMLRASLGESISSTASAPPNSRPSLTPATTSRTRERLRLMELERDEMRHRISRIEREGALGPTATEAELRILQLKYDVTKAVAAPRSTEGLFKSICSTDLLFLIDTTGSMSPYIDAVKSQVKSIIDDINVTFFNEAEVRIAVVGYKDHHDSPNIQFLDFTTDVNQMRSFLDQLHAVGGLDAPEDVLGGIRQSLNAAWKHQTRCIIHIADAPPHGRTLHDMGGGDSYPSPGSEPHGLTHEALLERMLALNINYALLRINDTTDRMALTFFQAYAAASSDCKLHKSNRYYSQSLLKSIELGSGVRGGTVPRRRTQTMLQFEELELGTTYSALRHLVVKSVTTSASRTATAAARTVARNRTNSGLLLSLVREDESDLDEVLETSPAQWDTPGWLNETLAVEAFSTDVVANGTSTLEMMMAHDDNIKLSTTDLTIHKRVRPFAQGAMRVAAYARTAASTNRLVVKSFKKNGKTMADLADDMRCQALCKAFALEFNALAGEEYSIDFIVVTCLRPKSGMATGVKCMSLEPFIEGTYVKYNSNAGWINEDSSDDPIYQAAQTFSHFTFERSRGRFLVSDLQGVGHVLTDPAIHTLDPNRFRLVDTNLGEAGFKFFFTTHKCNSICRKLRLKSKAAMIISDSYEFREKWPDMTKLANMTVCCSNKLCSRIVRVATARLSSEFPGYRWCDVCWPQLRLSMVKLVCIAPGAHHEFDVSKFFYESQGQIIPRICPKHRTRG
ncbi:Alpha-protein kinase vwkA [Cladobotryum mycophilum]|uniref:Alpha-protein kinase vwkA n=1 Tax=Cladobotryum mycophilum TaxID=491253 RepID=A0ABR0SPD1_9HYPO